MSEHEHNTDSPNCWCRPTPKGNNVYLHKTWAEFLEYVEQLEDAYGELASLKAENDALLEGIKDALNAEYTDVRRMGTDWDIGEARTILWNLLKEHK
jgi:hypothetical protein